MSTAAPPAPFSPDLADLRAFCLVVDLGSITAAARALGEAKGSVSRRLTRLEEGVGVPLLRRTPRLVQPTEVGAAYRARLGRAIELLDDATAQASETHDRPSGRLRVTAPIDLGQSLLAPLVAEFCERHPEVTVEMVLSAAVLDFDAHQIDVAIRAGGPLRDSSLIAHKIDVVVGALFASPSYLAKHGTPRAPAELADHRLVLTRPAGADASLTLRRGEEEPEVVAVRPSVLALDFSFAQEVAVAGGGVAMLPTIVARRDVEAGRLAPVLADRRAFEGALYLLHQGGRFLQPKVRAFRDFVLGAWRPRAKATRAGATAPGGRP
ncbi:MAG: LysR family transcriptional regulator [Polyangiales bacterium]